MAAWTDWVAAVVTGVTTDRSPRNVPATASRAATSWGFFRMPPRMAPAAERMAPVSAGSFLR